MDLRPQKSSQTQAKMVFGMYRGCHHIHRFQYNYQLFQICSSEEGAFHHFPSLFSQMHLSQIQENELM